MQGSAIQATRMELLCQRKRLALAQRGHRLLENKRDELMHHFLELIEQTRGLRERVEEKLAEGLRLFLSARAEMPPEMLNEALTTGATLEVQVRMENVMSVSVPHLSLQEPSEPEGAGLKGKGYSYGLATTPAHLDRALQIFADVLPEMIKLAELERAIELLADEIERTRRRVNALEQILIPQLEETIRRIQAALDEMERSARSQLLRLKGRVM
jgi:V/A-type H+-transporting ATPase subunit D